MARKLRIEHEGALYHVINRGNYRRDVFESAGAAQAFEETLWQACAMHGWKLMRTLRAEGVPYKWITEKLNMGKPDVLRVYVSRQKNLKC